MGLHKPALKVHGDNKPDMLVRTAALLHSCVPEVWVSCRRGQVVPGYTCLHDVQAGLGPIGGIYTALQTLQGTKFEALLVLSCDLPFMQAEILHTLLQAHQHNSPQSSLLMTTFQQAETGFIEALVSVYHRDCFALFQQAVDSGIRQINRVIPPTRRHDIVYERQEALPFFNINYPADLEMARRLIQSL